MSRAVVLTAAAFATLAGCAPVQPQPRSPKALAELNRYLDGRIAGKPQNCLPSYRADDMVIIDDNTVLFRDGSRVWRSEMQGGCPNLGAQRYAMVTRQFGTNSLCRGEIVQLLDTSTGTYAGSCSFGDFVPYERPR